MRTRLILDIDNFQSIIPLTIKDEDGEDKEIQLIKTFPIRNINLQALSETRLFLTGKEIEFVRFSDSESFNYDDINKFSVTNSGEVIFILDGTEKITECEAKNFITGHVLFFISTNLFFSTQDSFNNTRQITYNLIVKNNNGQVLVTHNNLDWNTIGQITMNLTSGLNLNETGNLDFNIQRSTIATNPRGRN